MIGDRCLRVAHHAFILLLVVASAAVLSAQTVVDPRFVEFNPSADHNTSASDGTPLVQRYSLSVYVAGSSVVVETKDLGKPTPSGGVIRVALPALVLTPGVVYEARVTAIGPGGSTASSLSNGFSFPPACAPSLNSTGPFGSGGGTGSVGVTVAAGCTWSATSNANWITLTGATGGTGNGSVPYSVAANTSTSARTGTLTVAGLTYSVNQAALSCTYQVSPTNLAMPVAGGPGLTGVAAPAGCAWTAVSNSTGWLTVTSGASGNGNGTVGFSTTANPNGTPRNGSITIAGQNFLVTQAAVPCTYTLTPPSLSVASTGGTDSTVVAAPNGCAWTAVSNSTGWLTVTSGASGNGDGTVGFRTTANPNGTERNGSITIAGRTFSVTQAPAPCSYSLTPASQSVASTGGTGSTAVGAPTGCAWTGVSNDSGWLTVTSGASGSGNGSVAFSASANASSNPRTGRLTIGGQTFSVMQAGAGCSYTVAPTSHSMAMGGGTGSTGVTAPAGCAWTAVSNNTGWLTVTSGASGNGDGTAGFSTTANPNGTPRNGSITIAGQAVSVTQAAAPCNYSLAPAALSVASTGETGSTAVDAPNGCDWTAVSNNTGWLTVTSGSSGSGDGSVRFNASANASSNPRTGRLTIGGQTFTVTQDGAPCTYSISPTSRSIAAVSASGSTDVTAPDGCGWSAISNNTGWLTVTSGASDSGDGSVGFNASANTSPSQRIGTLTVAGQTFTVTQAGAGCTFAISSTSLAVVAAGGTGSTNVTAGVGCPWSAASNNNWITVTSGGSGSGSGSVGFSVAANPGTSARTGTLTIATRTYTVSQAAAACGYSLTPTSRNVGSAGADTTTTVSTATGCAWTAVSHATGWLAIESGASGSGTGIVTLSANPNTTTQVRIGTATIAGETFTVTQNAGSCTFTVSPTTMSPPSAGANGSATVTSTTGCAWTATTDKSWITITSGAAGTGNGQVNFTVAPNTTSSLRSGTLLIAGRNFAVVQAANTCTYAVTPANRTIGGEGGTGTITVGTGAGCPWTATSNRSWISVSGTGTAAGSASYTVSPNTSGASRDGTITIGTRTFSVTQSAATSNMPAAPSGLRIAKTGG